ncbi:hypothetical protein AB0D11_02530 [Streptomyces monashensis]|uniref:hypothetical protein n=1 Tax=Streptomyces monashensis TaxID=1678012 RepID=UPI0033FB7C3E
MRRIATALGALATAALLALTVPPSAHATPSSAGTPSIARPVGAFDDIAYGTFACDGNGNFSGTYTMPDHTQRSFTGKFSSAVPAFSVPIATVTYNGPLTGVHNVSGVVGAVVMNVKLDNGPVLGGRLMPPLDRGYNVTGQGTWSATF